MNHIPLIGITTYHRDERGYVQLPAQYAESVRAAGAIPLLIQPGEPHIDRLMTLLDGIILSGGGDVDPALYSDESHEQVYWVDQARDQFELKFIQEILAQDKPLLCICRGLQILNVALGGTLIAHISDDETNSIQHRQPPRDPIMHEIAVQPDSRLAAIMQKDRVSTASWHHQAIADLAPGLEVVAHAPDGIIEAVEMPDHPNLIAVQWHPELTAHQDPTQQQLFNELVRMTHNR